MTGDENSQETEATLSRKFTQQPSNTYIVDGTAYPILAARLKMLNSGEVETKYVTPLDPANGGNRMPCVIQDNITPTSIMAISSTGGTPIATGLVQGPTVNSHNYVYNPGIAASETIRTPNKYKWAACTTTAATDLWTPAGGKKFRVMGGTINCAGGLVAAGLETVDLQEETLGTVGIKFGTWVPIAASAAASPQIYFDLRPNGYLATTADKKLQVVLGATMTAGAVEVTVWGTEE